MRSTALLKAFASRAGLRSNGIRNGDIRRRRAVANLFLIATICVVPTLASASITPKGAKSQNSTTVKPDYAYFRGKTITIYVTAQGAGVFDIAELGLAPYMEAHLGATVNVIYSPVVNTVTWDLVGHSAPDGLTLGGLAIPNIIYSEATQTGLVSFSVLGSTLLGASAFGPEAMVSCNNPSVTSATQLLSSRSNVTMLENTTLQGATVMEDLFSDMYSFPHTYIRAYTSTGSLVAGCDRGDGTVASTGAGQWTTTAGNVIAPGTTPLLISNSLPKDSPLQQAYRSTPTLAQFVAAHPPKTPFGKRAYQILGPMLSNATPNATFFGPHGIPKPVALALQLTIQKAWNTAAMHNALNISGYLFKFFTPADVVSWFKAELNHVNAMTSILAHP